MILETTNPKYHQPPLIPAHAKRYTITPQRSDLEYISQGSLDWAKGKITTERFVDRKPNEAPSREPEPRTIPRGSSLWLVDEAYDAPLWLILDRVTGVTFARVRGSLPWVVNQLQLAAHQLGGQVNDLYFKRAQD